MYAGHFAAAVVLRAKEPEAPFGPLLIGAGLLDLLFGPFLLAGIERASLTPGVTPGFSLDYIDWSHSLLMVIVWSLLFAALFLRRGRKVAAVMFLAVFTHFLLDIPIHPPDLALWPGSAAHIGFDLWGKLPTGWWFVELAFVLIACAYYLSKAQGGATTFGRYPWGVPATLVVLHVLNSPWLSILT